METLCAAAGCDCCFGSGTQDRYCLDAVRNGKAGNYIVSPEELKYFTPVNLERWHNLFEQSEKCLANDEAALFRLRKVRYELDMMILRKFHDFAPSSAVRKATFKSFADRLTDTLTKLKKALGELK